MASATYPWIPPELLDSVFEHHGNLQSRRTDPHSVLRHLSTPGHHYGEGVRRIFVGQHPGSSAPSTSSSLLLSQGSFLVGVDALEAEEVCLRRSGSASDVQDTKGKGRARQDDDTGKQINSDHGTSVSRKPKWYSFSSSSQSKARSSQQAVNGLNGSTTSAVGHVAGSTSAEPDDTDHVPDEDGAIWSDSESESDVLDDLEDSRSHGRRRTDTASPPTTSSSGHSPAEATHADTLFDKLRGSDARRNLSSGDERPSSQSRAPTEAILSHRLQESPQTLETGPAQSFATAFTSIEDGDSRLRPVAKTVSKATREAVHREPPDLGSQTAFQLEVQHNLLRRQSTDQVSETASDTLVALPPSRPKMVQVSTGKSVRWDATHGGNPVPKPKRVGRFRARSAPRNDDRSVEKGAGDPEEVLSRPMPDQAPFEEGSQEPAKHRHRHFGVPLRRTASTESTRLLRELGVSKEEALPPGIEKLERMLVRVGWRGRQDLPEDFNETSARLHPVRYQQWEEMAIVWKHHHLEIWGSYVSCYILA